MVDMFKNEICNYCQKTQCNQKIIQNNINGITIYKCNDYAKDSSKIIQITPPLIVTAHRDYISYKER